MPQLYVLVKPSKSKEWQGAIPGRKGVSLAKLRATVKATIRKGMTWKIVNRIQLERLLKSQLAKARKKPTRKIKRKKVVKRKSR